jgi:NADH dehydrogenase
VQDVAHAIVTCLQDPTTAGQIYEACGPDVFTLAELVHIAGRHIGHERPVLPLPHAIAWLQAVLMELAPGPTVMSRDNLASMKVDNVASGHVAGLSALGLTHARPLLSIFAPSA